MQPPPKPITEAEIREPLAKSDEYTPVQLFNFQVEHEREAQEHLDAIDKLRCQISLLRREIRTRKGMAQTRLRQALRCEWKREILIAKESAAPQSQPETPPAKASAIEWLKENFPANTYGSEQQLLTEAWEAGHGISEIRSAIEELGLERYKDDDEMWYRWPLTDTQYRSIVTKSLPSSPPTDAQAWHLLEVAMEDERPSPQEDRLAAIRDWLRNRLGGLGQVYASYVIRDGLEEIGCSESELEEARIAIGATASLNNYYGAFWELPSPASPDETAATQADDDPDDDGPIDSNYHWWKPSPDGSLTFRCEHCHETATIPHQEYGCPGSPSSNPDPPIDPTEGIPAGHIEPSSVQGPKQYVRCRECETLCEKGIPVDDCARFDCPMAGNYYDPRPTPDIAVQRMEAERQRTREAAVPVIEALVPILASDAYKRLSASGQPASRYQPSTVDEGCLEKHRSSIDSPLLPPLVFIPLDPDDALSRLDTQLHIASDFGSYPFAPGVVDGSGERPRDGQALWLWLSSQELPGLYRYIRIWGHAQHFPAEIRNWSAECVAAAYDEALAKIGGVEAAVNGRAS